MRLIHVALLNAGAFGAGLVTSWAIRAWARDRIDRVRRVTASEEVVPEWAVRAERLFRTVERAPPWKVHEMIGAAVELDMIVREAI